MFSGSVLHRYSSNLKNNETNNNKKSQLNKQTLMEQQNTQNKTDFKAELSYLYTPTQYLISNFLTTKNQIQDSLINTLRDVSIMKTQNESNQTISLQKLNQNLNNKKKQLEGIKRKLNKSSQQQMKIYEVMRKRIHRHEYHNNNYKKHEYHNNIKSKSKLKQPQQLQTTLKNEIQNLNYITSNSQLHKIESQKLQEANDKNKFNHPRAFQNKSQSHQKDQFNLNKQILLYMLNQSLKKQKNIIEQKNHEYQKIQQNKLQNKQMIMINQQYLCYTHSNNIKKQEDGQQDKNQQQKNNITDNLNNLSQIRQNLRVPLQINMTQIRQQSQTQNYLHQIFQYIFYQPKQDYLFMNGIQEISIQQNPIEIKQKQMLKYSQKDLLYQNLFIKQLEFFDRNLEQQSIQNEQKYVFSKFQGQIQLQCMLLRKKQQIAADILINKLQSNTHTINKYKSNLQFWVALCLAVQLIKTKQQLNQMKAIEIIRNKVTKMKGNIKQWQKKELQMLTSMLFLQQKNISLERYLRQTQTNFRQIFQQIYRLPDPQMFIYHIFTGALILNTSSCTLSSKQNPSICPLCNHLSEKVYKYLPLLTKSQSTFICRINQSIMNTENYPIMLPSNQIYSLNGLQSTKKITKLNNSAKDIEQYYCPNTQTWYNKQLIRKVYLA